MRFFSPGLFEALTIKKTINNLKSGKDKTKQSQDTLSLNTLEITFLMEQLLSPLTPCSKSVLPVSLRISHSDFERTFLRAPIIVVATISELAPVLRSVSQSPLITMCSFSPLANCDATMLSATSSREQRTYQRKVNLDSLLTILHAEAHISILGHKILF